MADDADELKALRELVARHEETIRSLELASQRKDEFLAVLGHELRNPLAAIQAAADVLRVAVPEGAATRPVGIVARQARTLTRIVDDMLDVSRVTVGKVNLARGPVEVCELVRRCGQALASEVDAAGHELTLELPASAVWVDGDAVRLEQVMSNLVMNAIKYTPKGGHIRIEARVEGADVLIRVVDDGIGIASEALPRVFDLFAQVAAGHRHSRGGLGLGLALVRSLVEMHGGTVEVRSAGESKGSTFEVRLPLTTPIEATVPTLEHTPTLRMRPLRIVVVEDNDDAREILRDFLLEWGHVVHEGPTARAGLELALAVGPDVLLVDIGLPDLDGYEVARRVRAGELDQQPWLIAMTGYGRPEDRARALEAGFDLHLVKPVETAKLRQVLSGCAGRRIPLSGAQG